MLRLFTAAILVLLSITPVLAQRVAQAPRGQTAPTSFSEADQIWKNTSTSLSRITGKPCLDEAAANTIALAEKAIAQLADFLWSRPVSGFMSDAEYAPIRSLDQKIGQLRRMLSEIKNKPPCPPPGTATPKATPTDAGQPAKPSVLNLPQSSISVSPPTAPKQKPPPPSNDVSEIREAFKLSKCLTDDEVRRVWELNGQIIRLNIELDNLKAARAYINSGLTLPDFIRKKYEGENISDEDARLIERDVDRNANKIYANPLVVQETEDLLKSKEAEYDALKSKKCPEDERTGMLGPHLGLQTQETFACLTTTERSADSNEATNRFKDCKDPLGIGIVAGYNFAPWSNNVRFGPFVSFDYAPLSINHTFPTGSYLGSRSHWVATAGIKGGIVTTPGVFLYGLTGLGILNQDLNINFGGPVTSNNTTVPGFTLGVGAEYQPNSWQIFGRPLSLFVQYQHTWWQDAHLDQPAASPLFNYAFRREDDTIKLGLNIYFALPASPASPPKRSRSLIVKEPPR